MSKSEFLMFLKHPLLLWLKKHDKSKLPPIDDNLQAIFDQGALFETYAERLFGDGVKIGWSIEENNYGSMPGRTQHALNNGATTLFQARFETDELTCITDVVIFDGNKCDLYEIKSGTSVKQENIYDLAFQTIVLEKCGYEVNNIAVVTANSEYVRNGEINIEELCNVTEVTDEVREELPEIKILIQDAIGVINQKEMPELSVPTSEDGDIYSWLDLFAIFNEIEPGSIFDLCWPKQKIADLHAMGIKNLVDIPNDFPLSKKQVFQVTAAKTNEVSIDEKEIRQCLSKYQFPLYFLDYETMASVIPPFDGMRPYQQYPFQYSLHIMRTPGAELEHYSYLHRDNTDPTPKLSEKLASEIGDSGTVLTWNQSFEKGCNDRMGQLAPKFKKFYKQLNDRIDDLCIPFKNNHYVHKDFLGSYSIKKVLPVLAPELSYADLEINEGGAAQRLWMGAVLDTKYVDQKDSILDDLDKYCELDTLAMVKIYEVLKSLCAEDFEENVSSNLTLF